MKMKRRDFLKGAAGGLALLSLDGQGAQARTVEALPPDALGILYDSTLCVGCNSCMAACKEANSMEPEQVGGGRKGRHIGPFFTAMSAFPVSPDLRHGHIRFCLESLIILRELFLHKRNEGVHLSKAHVTPSIPGRAEAEG